MDGSHRFEILGVGFDVLNSDQVISLIVASASRGQGGYVVTPNIDILRQAVDDPEVGRLVDSATLVVADGAPLEWASRIAREPRLQRTPGASLVAPLTRAAAGAGIPVLLLGGRPGASTEAAARLGREIPGLQIMEHCPPYGFEDDPAAWEDVHQAVAACRGGIVFCGFGCPKQERIASELHRLFPDTWFLGIGGSIDFLAGFVPRAPEWVQQAGFEWAFRLVHEPRRLARRYLVDGIPFVLRLMRWAVSERAMQGSASDQAIQHGPIAPVLVMPDRSSRNRTNAVAGVDRVILLPEPRPASIFDSGLNVKDEIALP